MANQKNIESIEVFSSLPDEALVTGPMFASLMGVSIAGFYRHKSRGHIPRGRKVGCNTRYVAGEIREYLADPEKWVYTKAKR